eukprot:347009-Rhodomonas_salina.1
MGMRATSRRPADAPAAPLPVSVVAQPEVSGDGGRKVRKEAQTSLARLTVWEAQAGKHDDDIIRKERGGGEEC